MNKDKNFKGGDRRQKQLIKPSFQHQSFNAGNNIKRFVTFKVVRNRFELFSFEIVEVLKEVVATGVGKMVEAKVKVVFDAVVGKMVDVAGVL